MQPEISHRCHSCGASIHDVSERAMFCPECGAALTEAGTAERDHESSNAATAKLTAEDPGKSGNGEPAAKPEVAAATAGKFPLDDRQRTRERTREKLQRASSAARGAIEENVKRVEKIHHVSTVMLEEATYDPSLRFVLVAVGLFILFVILLIITKVMG